MHRSKYALFDHLIGDAEQRGRRGEAGHPTILDRQNWFHSAFCVAGATAATGSRARARMQTRQSPKPMRSERRVTSPRGGNCAPSCGQPDPPAVGLASSNIAKPPSGRCALRSTFPTMRLGRAKTPGPHWRPSEKLLRALGRVLKNRDCSTIAGRRKRRVRGCAARKLIFRRRRHQPSRPPLARIRPGNL
jgi:hypothetical protein